MEVLSQLANGFGAALSPTNLLMATLGSLLGTLVGVLPGLGPTAAIAILFPLTTVLQPVPAIIMLAGIYYGAMYGGSTTAILLNIPGEVASVPTCLAATPDPIVRKWEGAIAEMVKDPAFLAAAERISMNIDHLPAAEMRAFVEKEVEGYTDMATKIGIHR